MGKRGLAADRQRAHICAMVTRKQWRAFIDHPLVEWAIFIVGVLLMIVSPLAGLLPGPGGILVFALGLAMVLKTSMWAKRRYVRFKRKQPKIGYWADWSLRRRSARRRADLRRQQRTDPAAMPPPAMPAVSELGSRPPSSLGTRGTSD